MTAVSIGAGLVLLFLGGDVIVRGAVALAERFGVSRLVIGLTIVGFGTSLPELVVSLNATVAGAPGIAVGNVVGSNIANILLILGVAAVIYPVAVHPEAVRRDGLFMVAVTMVFVAMSLDRNVGAYEGAALILLMCGYVGYALWRDRRSNGAAAEPDRVEPAAFGGLPRALPWSLGAVAVGIVLLVIGSHLLVGGAVQLARGLGVPEEVIGLTLVALGTSLPELATSVVAGIRRQSDVCLGNVLGSNIFNILGIIGLCAVTADIPIAARFVAIDLWVLLAVSILLIPFMLTGWRLNRIEGAVLIVLYMGFVVSEFADFAGPPPSPPAAAAGRT